MHEESGRRRSPWFLGFVVLALAIVGLGTWYTAENETPTSTTVFGADGPAAASSDDPVAFTPSTPDRPQDLSPPAAEVDLAEAIEIVEVSWVTDPLGGTDVVVLFRTDAPFGEVRASITVLGRDGQVLDTETAAFELLVPDQTFAVVRSTDVGADDIRDVAIDFVGEPQSSVAGIVLTNDAVEFLDDGGVVVRGSVLLPADTERNEVLVAAVLRDGLAQLSGTAFDLVEFDERGAGEFRMATWPTRQPAAVEYYIAS